MADYFVRCRCGSRHPLAVDALPCSLCTTPTFDFHRVCAGCRGAEAIALHAERILDVIVSAGVTL